MTRTFLAIPSGDLDCKSYDDIAETDIIENPAVTVKLEDDVIPSVLNSESASQVMDDDYSEFNRPYDKVDLNVKSFQGVTLLSPPDRNKERNERTKNKRKLEDKVQFVTEYSFSTAGGWDVAEERVDRDGAEETGRQTGTEGDENFSHCLGRWMGIGANLNLVTLISYIILYSEYSVIYSTYVRSDSMSASRVSYLNLFFNYLRFSSMDVRDAVMYVRDASWLRWGMVEEYILRLGSS